MMKNAAKAAGLDMPNIDPAQLAQATEAMGNMSPEQMEKLMKWSMRAQKVMGWCSYVMSFFEPVRSVRACLPPHRGHISYFAVAAYTTQFSATNWCRCHSSCGVLAVLQRSSDH